MRCAVTLSNIINRRPTVYPTSSQYLYYDNILNVGGEYFAPGEYTLSADLDPEEGKTITCYAVAYEDWRDYEHHTFFPTTGEANLPFTFTLSAVKRIEFFFGYAGFRSAEYGEGEAIEPSAVTNIKVAETGKPETEIYETVALDPQEIADSDVMAQAINSKSSVSLRVLPSFDAWGFAVRGLTIVRIYDLDLPSDRCIFKGRVSAVTDIMNDNGVVAQELTCVSAADFLEDTSFSDNISSQNLNTWVSGLLLHHNSSVDTARQLTGTVSGSAVVNSGSDYICKSDYGVFADVLTNEKYLRENDAKAVYEWRERYQNDTAYIDIAAKIGTNKDTAIVIGENLKNIRVDRMTDGGIYTTVRAVSGVNADGYRYSLTAANGEMYARYGPGRELIIVNDNIYFVGKGGREYLPSGGYNWHSTPATDAMIAALRAWADQEAAKLSDPPITITLAAADLAAMGYSGYERFEIGNSYPVVCPFVGLYGQLLRITGIKRRLSDGRIEQITISKGDTAGNAKSGTLSTQLSRLAMANNTATTDDDSKLIGITDQKIETQTDGVKTLRVTKDDYDSSSHDGDTLYIIDDDGEKSMALGDDPIMREGGGGVIETATVLSSGQMTEWAPAHDLVPTWFRGNAAVYYGQPPAKIIIQGQRATFGGGEITKEDIMSEIIFEFRDGTRQKLEVYIHRMSLTTMRLGVKCYDISGAAEIFLGSAVSTNEFTTSGSAQIGMILTVSELYANPDLELAPQYGIMLAVKIGDQAAQTATLPSIAASDFTGRNVDFGSAAERGFASGIARKTEPSG